LTGEEEIEQAATAIREETRKLGENVGNLLVVTLYSTLPPNMQ
jgi:HrpA-like RNA helicase